MTLPMFFENGTTAQCTTYIALPGNPNYLGEADLTVMARQIRNANGPSGSNLEYLFRLESALTELSADASTQDSHVTDIANRVRSLPAS